MPVLVRMNYAPSFFCLFTFVLCLGFVVWWGLVWWGFSLLGGPDHSRTVCLHTVRGETVAGRGQEVSLV